MKWALFSVWDKTGIVELAEELSRYKYNIMVPVVRERLCSMPG